MIIKNMYEKFKKYRPYVVLAVFIVLAGVASLYLGTSYARVRAVSTVIIEIPPFIKDQKSVKDYLAYLFVQYLEDRTLPATVASQMEVVLSADSEISIDVVSDSGGGTFKVVLTCRGYEIADRLLKSTIDFCERRLSREVNRFIKDVVQQKEREITFLRKYAAREKKLNKKRRSATARYEALLLDVAAIHLYIKDPPPVLRYPEPIIALEPSEGRSGSVVITVVVGFAMLLLCIEYIIATGVKRRMQWEIEKEASLPVLGMIPSLGSELEVREFPLSIGAEAFRALRSRIEYEGLKRIAIVSWGEREGVSTVCSNLALSMSSDSQSVTLIDANMRRPSIHSIFDISNDTGLSDVLIDTDPQYAEWVSPEQNLKLMVSGPVPPCASELLEGPRAGVIKEYVLSDSHGKVIFDLPPLSVCSDLFSVASMVDGVVLVVRAGMYAPKMILSGIHMLKKCSLPLVGLVMNEVDTAAGARRSYAHHR